VRGAGGMWKFASAAVVVLALLASLAVASASAAVSNPAVEGPIQGGSHNRPWNHSLFPLRGKGFDYTEDEYFFSGTATDLQSHASAPYKSRMLVRLPRERKDFNGIVVVEWLNVTGQEDLEATWPVSGQYLMSQGAAYVGVSAQLAGICCAGPGTLKVWDPQRYGSLVHPGDTFSHDIFSQAIQALRDPAHNGPPGVNPMRGMRVRDVVATGASQSASQLTTFVNRGYNRGGVDLYVIARGGGPYSDFSTPIFNLNEENNRIPQPDSARFVGWEEAGTAHAPTAFQDYSSGLERRDLTVPSPLSPVVAQCSVNRGTVNYSADALTYWGERYLKSGKMPPSAPRMKRDANGNLVRDANGLAEGGLRHPFIQVPVAFNSGEGCVLWGVYQPWPNTKIRSMYTSHCDYVTKVKNWADYEVSKGWMVPEDRIDAIDRAVGFGGPWPGESLAGCAAAASGTGCLNATGGVHGKRLGPTVLGRTRSRQRRALRGARLHSRGGIDRYCATGGGSFRIAYPTRRLNRGLGRALRRHVARRAVLIVTSSRRFSVSGVRVGARARTLRRRLRGERRVRIGRNTWYLATARSATRVYKTRRGRVLAVGIADRRLAPGRRGARRLLSAWRL
jgi:Alpha/beta hydrolase domain